MGDPRGIRRDELDALLRGMRPDDPSYLLNRWPLVFQHKNANNIRIIEESGEIISRASIMLSEVSFWGCRMTVGGVGFVHTRADRRERGYASRIMVDCMGRIEELGGDLMQVSGDLGLYRRLGCRKAGRVHYCRFAKHTLETGATVEVGPLTPEHLDALAEIHEMEPIRIRRPFLDFCTLFLHPFAGQVFTISSGGRPVAYVVVACNEFIAIPLHQQMSGRGQIIEYGGNRRAILSAIPHLLTLTELDLREMYCYIPFHDTAFLHLLEERRIPVRWSPSSMGTYKILNLPRLMHGLRPHLESRLRGEEIELLVADQVHGDTRGNDQFTFRYGEQEVVTNQAEHIVFGLGEESQPRTQGEELASVLRRVFPLPLIWHGLNLV